jgi:hypothetical protein
VSVREKFRAMTAFPGNLAFAIVWARASRRGSKKSFFARMLDATEDAMNVF